uniref:F-box protein At3g26010-like beta-propeller domain-containing protein n=1 Tax=Cannabis sativa TaxID=3483 RepID=A0A803QFH7_CANSA
MLASKTEESVRVEGGSILQPQYTSESSAMALLAQSLTEQLRPCMAPTDFTTLKILRSVSLKLFSLPLRGNYRYKVAVLPNRDLPVWTMFCSETGEWSEPVVTRPLPPLTRQAHFRGQILYRNQDVDWHGRMHWLESEDIMHCQGMVVFNLFIQIQLRWQFVCLPVETNLTLPFASMHYFCLGTSQGRLLLSQIYKVNHYFVLKVWELKDYKGDSDSWSLVHNVKLEIKAKLIPFVGKPR